MSEKRSKKRGVLFDLDGVLLDSEGQYSVFWGMMDKHWPTGIADFPSFIKGFNLARILNYFPDEATRQEVRRELAEYEEQMAYRFFDGALELLATLREAGAALALVTSSDRKKLQRLCRQYPEFLMLFDAVVTGDMVTNAKPHPECFKTGARLLGLDAGQCVVIEDSRSGLVAGRASGARVIGIATTLPASEVRPMCDLCVNAVSELKLHIVIG